MVLYSGEAAYRSEVLIHHPPKMTFVRVKTHEARRTITCIPQHFDPEVNPEEKDDVPMATVTCEIGKYSNFTLLLLLLYTVL